MQLIANQKRDPKSGPKTDPKQGPHFATNNPPATARERSRARTAGGIPRPERRQRVLWKCCIQHVSLADKSNTHVAAVEMLMFVLLLRMILMLQQQQHSAPTVGDNLGGTTIRSDSSTFFKDHFWAYFTPPNAAGIHKEQTPEQSKSTPLAPRAHQEHTRSKPGIHQERTSLNKSSLKEKCSKKEPLHPKGTYKT